MSPVPARPVEENFSKHFQRSEGCWEWTGYKDRHGYGRFGRRIAKNAFEAVLASRMSYELYVGAIPAGMLVCHHCDNPGCVRPDHLFIGTHRDNMLDALAKGRHAEAGKTHCKQGHPFPPRKPESEKRTCPVCNRAAVRRYMERKRLAARECAA